MAGTALLQLYRPRNAFFVFVFPMYELGELEKLPDKAKEGNKGGQVILKYGEI